MSNGDRVARPRKANLLSYLQLLRLPNVFTAVADVAMGFLVVHGALGPAFVPVLIASCCLYFSGMVLNDVYDYEVDLRERPDRPLPSGRISRRRAAWLGYGLLVAGVASGWLAPLVGGGTFWWRSGAVATLLAASIVLYDAILKRMAVAPLVMGACRFFNVLLGMSLGVAGAQWLGYGAAHLQIAAGIGIYIVGVTWFARTEATRSHRALLAWGLFLMILGAALLAFFPRMAGPSWEFQIEPFRVWPAVLAFLMLAILLRCFHALFDPRPQLVQTAIKTCLLSLIVLDASVVLLTCSAVWAIGVLALVVPAVLLGTWVYST